MRPIALGRRAATCAGDCAIDGTPRRVERRRSSSARLRLGQVVHGRPADRGRLEVRGDPGLDLALNAVGRAAAWTAAAAGQAAAGRGAAGKAAGRRITAPETAG